LKNYKKAAVPGQACLPLLIIFLGTVWLAVGAMLTAAKSSDNPVLFENSAPGGSPKIIEVICNFVLIPKIFFIN